MSINLIVYSTRDLLTTTQVEAALGDAGWAACFTRDPVYVWVGGVREDRTSQAPMDGVIYGWEANATEDGAIRELISQVVIDGPSARSRLAALPLVVACEASGSAFAFEPEELDELANEIPLALRPRIEATRTQYVLRISAGQGDLASRFLQSAGAAIAERTEGVRLDPQNGEWM